MSNSLSPQFKIIYDGHCQFCKRSIEQIKVMDLFGKCKYLDYRIFPDLVKLHPLLKKDLVNSQLHLITPEGKLYGGFFAFRQLAWIMPLLYPFLILMYLPFADIVGSRIYRLIAKNRYLFHFNQGCKHKNCFRS